MVEPSSRVWQVRVRGHFDAAHDLPGYPGECSHLHGHRWEVEVVLEGDRLNSQEMLIDFHQVKATLRKILPDHRYLNDEFGYVDSDRPFNPTAENIAQCIFREVRESLPVDIRLVSITLWESPECGVTYYESESE